MEIFDIIARLNSAHGPSGDEGDIRSVIEAIARPYADELWTDPLGNLIVHRRGTGPKVMLAAHMDSIGFIVTHIEKEGFLRCGRLGGVNPREALYTSVRFKNGAQGLFAKEEKAEFEKLKLDECYIDVGAEDEDAAKSMVHVGDTAIYNTPIYCHRDKLISPYLDNRASCAVLLQALERISAPENDLYFVFTVQEEVGLRGAKTAAYAIAPDYGIVVDVTDVDDLPGAEKSGTVQLGKGAGIKVIDSSVICHPAVVKKLEEIAGANEIPYQLDIMRDGGTDAGAIHVTRIGVRTGGVSIPCRYIHTPQEMASLADLAGCVRLITAFAQEKLEIIKY